MKKYVYLASMLLIASFISKDAPAQLVINGGSITLGDNAFISVQGDFTSNADVLGTGKIILNGTTPQHLNMNGLTIPNLEVNSTGGVILDGATRISSSLLFTNGKIQTGNFNFTLANAAAVTGAGTGKFIETTGTGQLRKEITTVGNYDLPIGSGTNYMPLQYQIGAGTLAAGAYVGTQLITGAHPSKPIRATDFIGAYWKPAYSGITGSTINLVGTYVDVAAGMTGSEALLNGIRYNGSDWSLTNNTINTTSNTVTYNSVTSGSDLYAMDKFLLVNTKAFLQGAYNTTTGLMSDGLRTPTNYIPTTDPYRSAPYSFTQTDNTVAEVVNASIFNTQASDNDNIVDWVFLELRNTSNVLVQTRSALLQKDGDVVDVDGINPVFFKNLDAGNYIVTVRHRNHLGIAAEASTNAKTLSVARPVAANIFDLRTATDAQIFGDATAYTTASHPTLGTINLLWGGNANSNTGTRYQGPSNDRASILTDLSNNELGTLTGYYRGDLNLNGSVRYSGPGNDRAFLLATVLSNSELNVRTQQIP